MKENYCNLNLKEKNTDFFVKVRIFREGHKNLQNLHQRFDLYYIGQIYGGDFAKICGLLRIYEPKKGTFLYILDNLINVAKIFVDPVLFEIRLGRKG